MRIAVLHQHVPDDALPDERDVLIEAEAIRAALERHGHATTVIPCDLDLGAVERRLSEFRTELAFNIVESLGGTGRLIHLVPALVEARGIPMAGCSGAAMLLTSSKVLSKQLMASAGLPVPPDHRRAEGPCIVKPIWEDASIGIDGSSVFPDGETASRILAEKGRDWFAEAYIYGREINVALLDGEVLPVAEVRFDGDWAARPKIVGYAAKWLAESFEYQHSRRTFAIDPPLELEPVRRIARACWELFDLQGWARVDFRVAEDGTPYVLEVNANPCISPNAGFAASVAEAGIALDDAIERIAQAGLRR